MNLDQIIHKLSRKFSNFIKKFDNFIFNSWYNKEFDKYIESTVRRHIEILRNGATSSGREYGFYSQI